MRKLPVRKHNRLEEYAYDTPNAYFITICTKDRRNILCDIVGDDAHIVPKKYGEIVQKYIDNVPEIKKYVIMPNHIHLIIQIDNGTMWASSPTKQPQSNKVSNIVRSIKTLTTKEIGKPIFQRSFHDHIIRGENDYLKIWNYIDTNPSKWKDDCFYTE